MTSNGLQLDIDFLLLTLQIDYMEKNTLFIYNQIPPQSEESNISHKKQR